MATMIADAKPDNWYIVGTRWIRCEVVKRVGALATVRLWNSITRKCDGETKTGRVRPGLFGVLVDAG